MDKPIKSRKGVYYDLEKSPYTFTGVCGDIFKFSSAKKLEIYTRKRKERIEWVYKYVDKINRYTKDCYKVTYKVISYIEQNLYNDVEV